jgi:hypothetical protein
MTNRSTLFLPISLIALGTGWLISALGFAPEIDWVWTIGLAAVGFLAFLLGGWNKVTLVAGLFFIGASGLSVLRQTGRMPLNVEVPSLVLWLGVLSLAAHHRSVPSPIWAVDDRHTGRGTQP